MIKAPFNFVPYNEDVYLPDWAEQVSHDIPFSDGKSGIIHAVITAKTPVFVRNGHEKDTEENEFSYYVDSSGQKQYFIPGSSIKGMIRSVFEANSFCKITQFNDSKFPYRDVSDREYRNKLKEARCGYLEKVSSDKYILADHGTPGRISIKEISLDLYNHFCVSNLSTNDSVASAKYDFVEKNHIKLPKLFVEDKIRNENKPKGVDNRIFYNPTDSEKDAEHGEIVFTGQNSRRIEREITKIELEQINSKYKIKGRNDVDNVDLSKIPVDTKNAIDDFINGKYIDLERIEKRIKDVKYYLANERKPQNREWRFIVKDNTITLNEIRSASGKAYEFVFLKEKERCELKSSDKCISDFFSMYQYSPDFKDYWLKKLNGGERIPVFFTTNSDKKEEKTRIRPEIIENIGLSYLFKYPYANTVSSAITSNHKNTEQPDLAEIVFGSIDFNIKGRIRFFNAKLINRTIPNNEVNTILATPRASYYPIYLKAPGTWKNPSIIKGRKRYVIYKQPLATNTNNNVEVETTFIPLPSGSQFEAKIFFHNLNEIELGALLSALTFHGNEQLFHSIGTAKPYGYGKINLLITKFEQSDIQGIKEVSKSNWLKYLSHFEKAIDKKIGKKWRETLQIINLHSIAKGIPDELISEFIYMNPNIDTPNENEFVAAKKINEYLHNYSDIIGNTNIIVPPNIASLIQIVESKEKEEEEKNKRKNESITLGTKYNVDDSVEIIITCEKPKKGIIVGSDVEVQIVSRLLINIENKYTGKIKQKANDGRITQVEINTL